MSARNRSRRRSWRYVGLSAAAALLLGANFASAVTPVTVVITVQSTSANAGDTNAPLEVVLTNNTSSAVTIGGFSFGVSVSNADLTFTGVTNGTTAAYIFPGADSLFGPDISVQPPNLPGQSLNAEDIFSTPGSGATVAPGATVGLGHMAFNVAANAPTEDIPVPLSSTISSLSDASGNAISFITSNGTVHVTAACPQVLTATVNDSITGTGTNQWDYGAGGWFYYSANNFSTAFQKDEHYAFTTGVKAHFRFTGNQVKIYTVKEPAGGNIRYTLDGDTAGAQIVSNYSPTQMGNVLSYASPIGNSGTHDLVIEVLGTHDPSASSNTITVDKAEVYDAICAPPTPVQALAATINDNTTGNQNNQFDYSSGGWSYYINNSFTTAFQMDEHYAFTTGTFALFRFNGTQVKIYTVKEPAGGNIRYTLDNGADVQTISNYSATQVGNTLSYTSPVVATGDHVLKIEVLGTHEPSASSNTITIDKAEVYVASTGPSLTATVNDSVTGTSNNQFDYGASGWFYYNNASFTTAFMHDEHYAFTTGVMAHFRFNGRQVKIYTVKEPAGGRIKYTLDTNVDTQTISNYSPTQVGNTLSYTSPVLPPGDHDLVIQVDGTHEPSATSNTITVDKAEVFN